MPRYPGSCAMAWIGTYLGVAVGRGRVPARLADGRELRAHEHRRLHLHVHALVRHLRVQACRSAAAGMRTSCARHGHEDVDTRTARTSRPCVPKTQACCLSWQILRRLGTHAARTCERHVVQTAWHGRLDLSNGRQPRAQAPPCCRRRALGVVLTGSGWLRQTRHWVLSVAGALSRCDGPAVNSST